MRILNTDQAQARPLHYMRVGQLHSYKNLARDLSSCLTLRSSSTGTASHSLLIGKRGNQQPLKKWAHLMAFSLLLPLKQKPLMPHQHILQLTIRSTRSITKQCLPTRATHRMTYLHQKPIFTTMENSSKRRRFLNYMRVCYAKNLRLIGETPSHHPRISERVASWCIVT